MIRFASEAKAILADPSFSREPSMAGLLDVLTYGYVTETNTMFDGIEMVLPATTLVFEAGETTPSEQRYWDFAAVPPFSGCVEDAKEEFSEILSDVTRDRLLGDVPYGMMLSGGIDSTLVTSFIVEHEPSLKTYTVTREDADDESAAAASMAARIGSDHHEVGLDAIDPVAIGARIPWMFDQPFFNDASFANYAVAQAIAGELTVAITGDGGDHAFSGTMRHLGEEIATQVARAPRPLVAVASAGSSIGTKLAGPRPSFRRAHQLMRVSQTRPDRRWLSLHEQNLPISYPAAAGPGWHRGAGARRRGARRAGVLPSLRVRRSPEPAALRGAQVPAAAQRSDEGRPHVHVQRRRRPVTAARPAGGRVRRLAPRQLEAARADI